MPTGAIEAATVTVTNSGTGELKIFSANTTARGTALSDKRDVFSLAANAVEGATISPGANASLEVQFRPVAAGDFTGTLTISSNAGTHVVDILGEAVDRPQEARAPQAERSRPTAWTALRRVGRRRRGQT